MDSKEKYPLVTIGLSCYNAKDTIGRALNSALGQDWPNFEVVIVDDLSSDGSADLVEIAIAQKARARIVRHTTNTGPAGARNTILSHAKGEYVAFFDDDDEAMHHRISDQVGAIIKCEKETGTHLVACYASGRRHYENGYVMDLPAIGIGGNETPHGPGIAAWLLYYQRKPEWDYGSGMPACSLMARLSTFQAVGGFDVDLRRVEDADLAIRLALKGCYFTGTEEPSFIQYATSAPDKSPEMNLMAEQILVEKYAEYLKSAGRYYYAKNWPLLRYYHFTRKYVRLVGVLLGLILRYPIAAPRHFFATAPARLRHEGHFKVKSPTLAKTGTGEGTSKL